MFQFFRFSRLSLVAVTGFFALSACDKNDPYPAPGPDSAPINQQAPAAADPMQQPMPMQQAPAPMMEGDISDEHLREYVEVSIQAAVLQQHAQQQMQVAQQSGNQEMAQQVMMQMQGQMQQLIEMSALSGQELEMIGQRVQNDPEMQTKAQAVAEEIMLEVQQQSGNGMPAPSEPGQ